jgi:geranylgeranyl pyrophosphate synthase
MFEPRELQRLAPRVRPETSLAQRNTEDNGRLDPITATEAIAYEFLSKGGKHSRPFITLAAYCALKQSREDGGNGRPYTFDDSRCSFPDAVKRTAVAVEVFHKASLVHDDIEDDDDYRYGDETIHRRYGTATAINVGDYLIGLGYRLLSSQAAKLGADVVTDILTHAAHAHVRLTEGQGAELVWRDSLDKQLTSSDAIRIYELKTAPAFEAALFSGLRLAGHVDGNTTAMHEFAHSLGVAFQILNDLGDWIGDNHNKLAAGGDVLGGRPTLLWALALERLEPPDRDELLSQADASGSTGDASFQRVRELYEEAGVFDRAMQLVDQYRHSAMKAANQFEPPLLKQLLLYLVEKVLSRPESAHK